MFYGVSHIDIPVTNLEKAAILWRDVLGFTEIKKGEGFMDLNSGAIALRILEIAQVKNPVSVRILVPDVKASWSRLLEAGALNQYEPMKTPALELVASVADQDNNSILVWRQLTEDEWDFVPELPKQGQWQGEAEQLLINLLSYVPAFFRPLARRKVTRVAEMLAAEDQSAVTREHVIKSYITSSAKVTRSRLIEPLRKEGIDPDQYQEEFEYE